MFALIFRFLEMVMVLKDRFFVEAVLNHILAEKLQTALLAPWTTMADGLARV